MVNIIEVDFENTEHCNALIELMKHYMMDVMGDHPPHNNENAEKLIAGLKKHCNKLCLLAEIDGAYVGLTNCFIGFGTFAAKAFINIHDVVVLKEYRAKGIGRKLLEKVADKAKEMDCAKITLEVRKDNYAAQRLYKKMGYNEENHPMYFWSKHL